MKTESIAYQDGAVTLRGFLAYDDRKSGLPPRQVGVKHRRSR
jgi:hypothetical protein